MMWRAAAEHRPRTEAKRPAAKKKDIRARVVLSTMKSNLATQK